jgi:hypothetical protein
VCPCHFAGVGSHFVIQEEQPNLGEFSLVAIIFGAYYLPHYHTGNCVNILCQRSIDPGKAELFNSETRENRSMAQLNFVWQKMSN